jgi:RimJ/RimL family protein N-acetyltransferase
VSFAPGLSGRRSAAGDLALRPWRLSDAPALLVAYADRSVPPSWEPRTLALGETDAKLFLARARADWQAGSKFSFAIVRASDGRLLGGCSVARLSPPDDDAGQLGYWLASAARGQGNMGRALEVLIAFAFGDLGLRRLRLIMRPGNAASAAVAARASFIRGEDRSEQMAGISRVVATYWLTAPELTVR